MNISKSLQERAESKCELCNKEDNLIAFLVAPKREEIDANQVVVCEKCNALLSKDGTEESDHWRALNNSMWSQIPAIQVLVYRQLKKLKSHDWADDLLNMIFLEPDIMEWVEQGEESEDIPIIHKDCNGAILEAGDSVTLVKDLNVKGANFTAKRGTAVRRISLVRDNAGQIEGRVNDQHIVILTQYVKKS